MIVKCPNCGNENVAMCAMIEVRFKFNDEGNVEVISDVADDIFWNIEYDGVPAECRCENCGRYFSYDEWKKLLKEMS